MLHQETWAEGREVVIRRPARPDERHSFDSASAALQAALVINDGLSWIGTPFKNCGDVKGPAGCVDCAMLLVRTHVDTGILPPFDPRPYSASWFLHQTEEKFLGWIKDRLGGVEIDRPRVGDCLVYRFGKCFSHGAILINSEEVVHAFYKSGIVHVSRLDEQDLSVDRTTGAPIQVKYFKVSPPEVASRSSSRQAVGRPE
jgi:cell wall-associated NlpC family hydrolase